MLHLFYICNWNPHPINWEKLHNLPLSYFSVCRALVDEVNYGISQVDPKKTVQVGSFRVDGNGNQNTYKVSSKIQEGIKKNCVSTNILKKKRR